MSKALDVSTLRLTADTWYASAGDWPPSGVLDANAHSAVPTVELGRSARDFRVSSEPGWLSVSFAPKDPKQGVGCRVMAQAWLGAVGLHEAAHASTLVVTVRDGTTHVRGLLTLQVLADARWRSEVLDQTDVVLRARQGASPRRYEAAAVEFVASSLPGWERLDPGLLQMQHVESESDGLLKRASDGRIVVIEAKARSVTFEEGASQLFQYAAQARWALNRPSGSVRFVLVTSDAAAARKLDEWRTIMRRAAPRTILVPAECLRHVTLT